MARIKLFLGMQTNASGDAPTETWVNLPNPHKGGITRSSEAVWSSNKGVTASGKTVGTLIRSKQVYTISFVPMKRAEYRVLCDMMSAGFVRLQIPDVGGDLLPGETGFERMDGVDERGTVNDNEFEVRSLTGQERSWHSGQQVIDNVVLVVAER